MKKCKMPTITEVDVIRRYSSSRFLKILLKDCSNYYVNVYDRKSKLENRGAQLVPIERQICLLMRHDKKFISIGLYIVRYEVFNELCIQTTNNHIRYRCFRDKK